MSHLKKKLSLPCVFTWYISGAGQDCNWVSRTVQTDAACVCAVSKRYLLQELLFCETCDTVFCTLCTGGSHSTSGSSCEHTIIPFSIAIKRMSEILLYKANECISKVRIHCNMNLLSYMPANCEVWPFNDADVRIQTIGTWGFLV